MAGSGRLPIEVAQALRRRGARVCAVGFSGITEPRLAASLERMTWLALGQLEALIATLRGAGVSRVVFAGAIPKALALRNPTVVKPDARALGLLARVSDRGDDTLLRAVARVLEDEGIAVCGLAEVAPELLAGEGPLGRVAPRPEQLAEVAFAWPLAKAVGRLDIGQTLVVRERAVIAVEAAEGTDATIRRAGELAGPGVCVVKVAKPGQDLRFDLPTIGPDTVASLVAVRASILAVEAGSTLVLERERTVEAADANGICLLGYREAAGPAGSP